MIAKLWPEICEKLSHLDVRLDPSPIDAGPWGQAFRAIRAGQPLVARITRDDGEIRVAGHIVSMTDRGFRLDGFPSFLRAPIELGRCLPPEAHLVIREAVEPLTALEQTALRTALGDVLDALGQQSDLYSRSWGRGLAKYRAAYIQTTKLLDDRLPHVAASLRAFAGEKLLIVDVKPDCLARCQGRIVLYNFRVHLK